MRDEKARRCGTTHISKSKCQNTSASEHFWKMTWWKSAGYCGAKHISKSKCTKHTILRPLLEVEILKKCRLLLRKAHFQVKSAEHWRVRSTFGRSDVVLRGRCKGLRALPKVSKTWRFLAVSTTTTTTLYYTTLYYPPLHYIQLHYTALQLKVQLQLHYTTLIKLHYTTLITLHDTTRH